MSLFAKGILVAALFGLLGANSPAVAEDLTEVRKRPNRSFPAVGGYEVLCCDFHMHTTRSDGKTEPRKRVLERWSAGYDVIAITDHSNCDAYEEALPLAESLGMTLIRGLETGMKDGEHYVVIGISPDYKPQDAHSWAMSDGEGTACCGDRFREIVKAGGLVVYAHPHMGFREPTVSGVENRVIQGIEVFNAEVVLLREKYGWEYATVQSHGAWCYPFAFDWALEQNLAVFANSDIHGDKGGANEPVTLVLAKGRDQKAVMDAVRDRRTIAWFSGMLWGRDDVLQELLRSMIEVDYGRSGQDDGYIRVRNLGPVPMKARLVLDGASPNVVEIDPYCETLVPCKQAQDTLKINWLNVWINSRSNPETAHRLTVNR